MKVHHSVKIDSCRLLQLFVQLDNCSACCSVTQQLCHGHPCCGGHCTVPPHGWAIVAKVPFVRAVPGDTASRAGMFLVLPYGMCCSGASLLPVLWVTALTPTRNWLLGLCAQLRGGNSSNNKNTSSFHHGGQLMVIKPVAFSRTWKWLLPCDTGKSLSVSIHF